MPIHHSQVKKAEKMGCTIEEVAPDTVFVFWPKRALKINGISGSDGLAQMQAAQVLVDQGYTVRPTADHARLVNVYSGDLVLAQCPTTPVAAYKELVFSDDAKWTDTNVDQGGTDDEADDEEGLDPIHHSNYGTETKTEIARAANGVALDGAIAYKEGTPSGDCPFTSETEDEEEYANFEAWNEAWDNAADEATEEEDENKVGGSVVGAKYRARYAEQGHPTHCGDWLAEVLNNICGGKAQTDLDLFERICGMNGVDTGKYRRSGVGWQGRIRMTGRNLLAKRIFLQGGELVVPASFGVEGKDGNGKFVAPSEWMASQRFKMPKATG